MSTRNPIFLLTTAFILVSLVDQSLSIPIIEDFKGLRYEEYEVEHEISSLRARNSALSIDLNSVKAPPGCQACSQDEISYCLGQNLINDHCCCDKRYHEVLPFIPHTCYIGTKICKPIARDCEEYTRLRTCCCDKYVLEKWKKKSKGVRLNSVNVFLIGSAFIVIRFVNKLI